MKPSGIAALAAALLALGPAAYAKDQCLACHESMGGKHQAIVKSFAADIHREKGLSCSSCHGGDPAGEDAGAAMNPAAGFVGAPSKADIPKFCGKCHSQPGFMKKYNPSLPVDQELKYFTSVHGRRLKAGDDKVAACSDCHTAHSIRPAKDPASSVYAKNVPQTCGRCHADAKLMAPYKIPTDQLVQYIRSVHGRALLEKGDTAAPACNTCHGNHGAAPPGVADIGQVCGMCHVNNAEFFKSSPMAKAWAKRKFHMCATCHTAHDIQHPTAQLLSSVNGLCLKCHRPDSASMKVAASMKSELELVESSYLGAKKAILAAEQKGMDMSEARDLWDAARMSMYQAKTAVHTFRAQDVAKIADQGIASARRAMKAAWDAVADFRNRRVGLGVASLLITCLVLAIYLKLRDIEGD
jgi:hypothetical protein